MKLNENIAIYSAPTLLVPYCKHHVSTYHQWMQDEETRSKTASDLLTLEEEYANQLSWRNDPEKLTFIVCLFKPFAGDALNHEESREIPVEGKDSTDSMIGDVNIFLNDYSDGSDEVSSGNETSKDSPAQLIGEINLMIARQDYRRMGLGRSALTTFLGYVWTNRDSVVKELEVERGKRYQLLGYQAKIDKENEASIKLFEGIGFKRTREEPNYFGEVEMVLMFETQDLSNWSKSIALPYKTVKGTVRDD